MRTSNPLPPLSRACKQTYAEFIPIHRRLTTHHVCIDHFVSYTNTMFPTKDVHPNEIAKYEGTICIGVPWFRAESEIHGYAVFQLLPLMQFFGQALGVRLWLENVPSIKFHRRNMDPLPLLASQFQRDTPANIQWMLDPQRTEYKVMRGPLRADKTFWVTYGESRLRAPGPARLENPRGQGIDRENQIIVALPNAKVTTSIGHANTHQLDLWEGDLNKATGCISSTGVSLFS